MIPTRGRPRILRETLDRLAIQAPTAPIEVLVAHDGTDPVTGEIASAAPTGAAWPVRSLVREGSGPARRRNTAIAEARAPVCLFIGDDTLAGPDLISGHLAFHEERPDDRHALLGLVVPAPPLDRHHFIRWLHEGGAQFGYGGLEAHTEVGAACFWTANVSVKTDLLRSVGGFDEAFPAAAGEDAELGFRLARAGMHLHYDPTASAEHFHPTDLETTVARMRRIGDAFRLLCERAPEAPAPRRPGARHRLKAAGLTVALGAAKTRRTREAAWRFLCDETLRESYWSRGAADDSPRIGRRLLRIALADPESRPPAPDLPAPR